MKVLIIGSEGQLGRELMSLYPEAIGTSHVLGKQNYVTIEDDISISKLLRGETPEVVINTAALTNVDRCEKEKKYAFGVNGLAVRSISLTCREIGAKLVQVSTDYVFDGTVGNYSEDSFPNPVNYYGLSKLAGDLFAYSSRENLIVRTSGVFGYSNNFPLFVFKKLKNGETVNAIKGFYSPLHARNLARSIQKLISLKEEGIVNVAGERVSRMDIAMKIADYFGFDSGLVKESDQITSLQAKRPFDSSLNIEKARGVIDFDFYTVQSNLEAFEHSVSMNEKKL